MYSICDLFDANMYCNALGGQKLYSKVEFLKRNIDLSFTKAVPFEYKQGKSEFIDNLSMIDVLMWNSKDDVIKLLEKYKLV